MATNNPRAPDAFRPLDMQNVDFVQRRPPRGVGLIWLIPLVALGIAAWLGWNAWSSRGPVVTVTFAEASGLEPGRTKVRYKAIEVGEVSAVSLGEDLGSVVVTARMHKEAAALLTEGARFWVVRPRVGEGQVSGLETIVSGAYIELDRGPADAAEASTFRGLDVPPPLRSDVPGRSFLLQSPTLGGLDRGSPVYFRDVQVGQVLRHDFAPDRQSIEVEVFVREPFDQMVHEDTRFWNISGVQAQIGPSGLNLSIAPVPKLVRGGIAFDTDPSAQASPRAGEKASFTLYANESATRDAGFVRRDEVLVYVEGMVRGLQAGSPVEVRGIRIGEVTDVRLVWEPATRQFVIPVRVNIATDRITDAAPERDDPVGRQGVLRDLVAKGFRAQVRSGNIVTGEQVLALDFIPNAPPAELRIVDGLPVIPSVPPSLDTLERSLTTFMDNVAQLPINETLERLNATLASLEGVIGGDETKQSLTTLNETMVDLQRLTRTVGRDAAPLLGSLRSAAERLDATLGNVDGLVGRGSPTLSRIDSTLRELEGAARSIRTFADYLQRHPEALVRGKGGVGQ